MPSVLRLSPLVIAALIFSFGLIAASVITAQAQEHGGPNIEFPIPELGNCENEDSCKAYCDNLVHINECVAFGLEHGLMTADEAEEALALGSIVIDDAGPGGCDSQESCHAYCEDIGNIQECIAFAEEHDILPEDELKVAQRVAAAVESGVELPGGCSTKEECEMYCENPANIGQCLAFAEETGFLTGEELEEARKIADYVDAGGELPGGCISKDQCEAYCDSDAHIDECVAFAIDAGFVSDEEAEMMRKTGGRGPGGCRGQDECEAFCETPENQEACYAFALEHDLITEEDKRHMEEGLRHMREALEQAPPETLECIRNELGDSAVEQIENGDFLPGPRVGDQMRACFERFMGPPHTEGEFEDRGMPPEVKECMTDLYGPDFYEQFGPGDFESEGLRNEIEQCMRDKFGDRPPGDSDDYDRHQDDFREHDEYRDDYREHEGGFMPGFPPEVAQCAREAFGDDFEDQIKSGTLRPTDIEDGVRECMKDTFMAPMHNDENFGDDHYPPEFDDQYRPPEDFKDHFEPPYEQYENFRPPEYMHEEFDEYKDQFVDQYRDEFEKRFEDEYRHFDPAGIPINYDGEYYPPPPPPDQYFEDHQYAPPPPDGAFEDYGNYPPPVDTGFYPPPPEYGDYPPPPEHHESFDGGEHFEPPPPPPGEHSEPPPSEPVGLNNPYLANVYSLFMQLLGIGR